MDAHNTQCAEKIKPPPCSLHNTDLTCSDVYKNIGGAKSYQKSKLTIDEALKNYRCPAQVDVQLPCQHIVQMTCAEETDIANEKESYPECKELAHSPFVYPGCFHELTVLCVTWFEYKKDPTSVSPCKEQVNVALLPSLYISNANSKAIIQFSKSFFKEIESIEDLTSVLDLLYDLLQPQAIELKKN